MESYPPPSGYANSLVPPLNGLARIIVLANSPSDMWSAVSAKANMHTASKNAFVSASKLPVIFVKGISSHSSVFSIEENARGNNNFSSLILLFNGINDSLSKSTIPFG